MQAVVDSFIDGADIILIWIFAGLNFWARIFILEHHPIPTNAEGWVRIAVMAAPTMGLVAAQEHFRGKNRAARIRNIWRRALVILFAGLGPAIGGMT